MIESRHLLLVAVDLASWPNKLSTLNQEPFAEAALRRAVSTLYYACFHRVMKFVADVLAPEAQGSIAWVRVYRSLDHRTTRNRLAEAARTFPVLEPFCQLFAKLLDQRQLADYSTEAFELTGNDVFQLITEAANAMKAFETLSEEQRLSVAVMLLLPERKENTLQR